MTNELILRFNEISKVSNTATLFNGLMSASVAIVSATIALRGFILARRNLRLQNRPFFNIHINEENQIEVRNISKNIALKIGTAVVIFGKDDSFCGLLHVSKDRALQPYDESLKNNFIVISNVLADESFAKSSIALMNEFKIAVGVKAFNCKYSDMAIEFFDISVDTMSVNSRSYILIFPRFGGHLARPLF